MERLKLMDEIRKKALSLMDKNPSLTYEVASREAKMQITGEDTLITEYHQGIELRTSILEIARRVLPPTIKIDLYREDQLKEMIVAVRLGINLESFLNVFLTPEQIRFLTLASLKGEDMTKYTNHANLNPQKELVILAQKEKSASSLESGYQKTYIRNEYRNVA